MYLLKMPPLILKGNWQFQNFDYNVLTAHKISGCVKSLLNLLSKRFFFFFNINFIK